MKLLVADDDPIFRRVLKSVLVKWGFECQIVCDGTEALAELQKSSAPQLAILDWMMPGLDGTEVVRRLREATAASARYTYVLLLTARTEKCDVVKALRAGCDDCLSKPFLPDELHARLLVGQRIVELEARLTAALETMQHQASHDALTGIRNRGAVLTALQRELDRAERHPGPLSVILLDLDHFKLVNDTYGHLAGDRVLLEVARRMQSAVRSYDAVGRFGGEEFLIVLPQTDSAAALTIAHRIAESIRAAPVHAGTVDIPMTASMGVASSSTHTDMQTLLHAADCALYDAKAAGRNRVEVAAHAMPVPAQFTPSVHTGMTAH